MTRPPHVHWAVGGAQASARLLPPCPFSGGAPLANGTRCCPSSLPAWSAPARAARLILPPIPACLLPLQRLPAVATPISPLSPSVMRPGIPSTSVSTLLLSFWRVDPLRPSRAPLPLSPRLALPLILGYPLLLKRVLGALLFPTAGLAAVLSLRLARANVLVRLCVFGVFRVIAVLVEFRGPVFVVISLLGASSCSPWPSSSASASSAPSTTGPAPSGVPSVRSSPRASPSRSRGNSPKPCQRPRSSRRRPRPSWERNLPSSQRPSLLPLDGHGLRELDLRGRPAYMAIALPIALARVTARFAAVLPRDG
ncbi:unnamed protein product [Closterium sp. NIES-65]|nr:unnamed protein product [Closterium sp. NIES-65]